MEALGGRGVWLELIHDLGNKWGLVVSVTPRPRFSLEERTPGTHCTGGWVGPRAGLYAEATGKILFPCQGSNLDRPVVQSVTRRYTELPGLHLNTATTQTNTEKYPCLK
jgi:hypothetical protein